MKNVALLLLVAVSQFSHAGIFGVHKIPFKHPVATAVLVGAGYSSIKAYCAAGAPATQVDDGTGRRRLTRIDCASVSERLERDLGGISEHVEERGGVLAKAKNAIAKKNDICATKEFSGRAGGNWDAARS